MALTMSCDGVMIEPTKSLPKLTLGAALWRGLQQRCPSCGLGAIFGSYLRVNEHCSDCGLELAAHRSDDAPAYFTILIVGHLIVPGVLLLEQTMAPPTWVHMVTWLPLTLALTLALLPRIKGALLSVQWMLRIKSS